MKQQEFLQGASKISITGYLNIYLPSSIMPFCHYDLSNYHFMIRGDRLEIFDGCEFGEFDRCPVAVFNQPWNYIITQYKFERVQNELS